MIFDLAATVDVDNDGVASRNERSRLEWQGLRNIEQIKSEFASRLLPVTWFVRADWQLRQEYGNAGHLLTEHSGLWEDLRRTGDEIGWHPHIYRRESSKRYVPESQGSAAAQQLEQTYAELQDAGYRYDSVRVGEARQWNETMVALSRCGLRVDSTALPGRKRHDCERHLDWHATPNHPYHPSRDDYSVPGPIGCLRILEVPMTTMPVLAPYDPAPVRRYVNLTFHTAPFAKAFDSYLSEVQRDGSPQTVTTMILHPDEVSGGDADHPLYAFSLEAVRTNLDHVLTTLSRAGHHCRFVTMSQVPDRWDEATAKGVERQGQVMDITQSGAHQGSSCL